MANIVGRADIPQLALAMAPLAVRAVLVRDGVLVLGATLPGGDSQVSSLVGQVNLQALERVVDEFLREAGQ